MRALFSLERNDKLSRDIVQGTIGEWAQTVRGKVDVIISYYPEVPTPAGVALRQAFLRTSRRISEFDKLDSPKRPKLLIRLEEIQENLQRRKEELQDRMTQLLIRSTGAEILSSSVFFENVTTRASLAEIEEIANFDWVRWADSCPSQPSRSNQGFFGEGV